MRAAGPDGPTEFVAIDRRLRDQRISPRGVADTVMPEACEKSATLSTCDAELLDVSLPDNVDTTVRNRANTSPIWQAVDAVALSLGDHSLRGERF